jgi:polyhydroxyalkanoate synthesis repressor PhaR
MRIIKKYPNRRLYDTESSAYITLSAVHELVRKGIAFKVVDAESGDDLTRSILIQIIIEQEAGEKPMFSEDVLTKFIRFYDDAAQHMFGEFLEKNLKIFGDHQKKFQDQVGGAILSPLARMVQDMTERNLEVWQDMQKNFLDLATTGLRPGAEASAKPRKPKRKK